MPRLPRVLIALAMAMFVCSAAAGQPRADVAGTGTPFPVVPVGVASNQAAAEPVPGTLTTVNSTAAGDQDEVEVATNRAGHVAVVWADDRDSVEVESGVHSEIYLRLYADGVSRYERRLSGSGVGGWRHVTPDLALDDDGNATVVWAGDPDGNGYANINATVVRPDGSIVGSTQVNASGAGEQQAPAVAADPDGGGFTVAWTDRTSAPATVRAAGFAAIGFKRYEKVVAGSGAPVVAMSAAGHATVVAESGSNLALSILTVTGTDLVPARLVSDAEGSVRREPAVASAFGGDIVVAWQELGERAATVRFRIFERNGRPRHPARSVALGISTSPQSSASVGVDDQANPLVAWRQAGQDAGGGLWIRGFNRDSTSAGRTPLTRLSTSLGLGRAGPAVAVSPWGEVHVGYSGDGNGNGCDQVLLRTGLANSQWLPGPAVAGEGG